MGIVVTNFIASQWMLNAIGLALVEKALFTPCYDAL